MACQASISPLVDDGLHCKYCSSVYNDPRILSCLHSFCLQCLTRVQEEDMNAVNYSSIICPSCKHKSPLPIEGDVASLPVNLRLAFEVEQNTTFKKVFVSSSKACESCEDEKSLSVAYCNDCNDLLCDDCWKVHRKQRVTKTHTTLGLDELKKKPRGEQVKMVGPSIDSIPNCHHHDDQKLSFYCHADGCRVPVCVECTVDRHGGHEVKEIKKLRDIADYIKTKLFIETEKLNGSKGKLEEVLQKIDRANQDIQTRKNEVDVHIRNKFDKLRRIIDQRERELLEENTTIVDSKQRRLSTQYDGIYKLTKLIDSCVSMTTSATDEYSTVQLLAVANTLSNRVESLQQQYNDTHLDLVDSPSIGVNVRTDDMKKSISAFGSVSDLNADGAQSFVMLPRQILGLGATMDVKVNTRNSLKQCIKQNNHGLTKVKAKLVRGHHGNIISDDMAVTRQGNLNVHVKSNSEGDHKLYIAVNGLDVQGSPFDVMVVPRRDYTEFNRPVHTISGIPKSRYIAFAGNGDIYVTSDGDHRIHVCDWNGVKKTTIGSGKGSGRTQFDSPYGIDIHGDVVYVADYGNHRIQQLTTGGEFIRVYGQRGSGHGQFNGPHDVKFNGKVYVADTNNDRVQVFNPADWSVSHVIDGTVRGDCHFSKPKGIAFDLSGNVCVSAYGSNAVMVFNTRGGFIHKFAVTKPTGIAVDAFGYYLVNSYDEYRLFIYNSDRRHVHTLHKVCSGYGIVVSPLDQSVWVADPYNNQLMKF